MSGVHELPLVPEEKLMKCESNQMCSTFDMEIVLEEQSRVHDTSEDVDVTLCTNFRDNGLVESECQDSTENSSSFGNSLSDIEDASGLNDTEVESRLRCTDTSASVSVFDGYGDACLPRKKRLTDHWRKFIRPLMWRCKWIELQIKEFKSQAHKYDKELAEHDKVKQLTYERYMLEGFDAKTLPFSSQIQRKKVMKRRKRKRVEETVDISSYLSQHNLFSYYDDKRLFADAPLDDNCGTMPIGKIVEGNDESELNDGWLSLESWNDHDSTEPILRKIEEVRSQIGKLKTRIDKVMSEHKLSSLVPCDASNSSDQNTGSPKNVETERLCKNEDLPLPESACSSLGEVTPLPNMLDFTNQHRTMCSYGNMEDEILIHNQDGKEGLNNFERMGSQLIKNPEAPNDDTPPVVIPVASAKTMLLPTSEPDTPKNTRTSARKRKSEYGR